MKLTKPTLDRIKVQSDTLWFLIQGFSERQIKTRIKPEKWSVFENMAHLGRYQEIFIERIKKNLKENNPSFERYIAENDTGFAVYQNLDLEELSQKMKEKRQEIIDLLIGIDEKLFAKTGVHPKFGKLKIPSGPNFFYSMKHSTFILFLI